MALVYRVPGYPGDGPGRDDLRPEPGGGREYAVESDGVLARSRHEGQKSLNELERRERDRRRAVGKWPLEAQHDAPVGELGKPVGGDGRPSQISRQMLESFAIIGRDAHRGVQTESLDHGAKAPRPLGAGGLQNRPDARRARTATRERSNSASA
jgi:hypothetical protein